MSNSRRFKGQIKIASRIVDYLSSGLYHNPAACLKELVNNSYDADAELVNIFIKPDADRIIIEDDGAGMSEEEFTTHFARVSESHKRDDSETTLGGRPKIGKIGIGFIAANEICEVMELYSTQAGSTDLLYVEINFAEMRLPVEKRRDGDEIRKGDFEGEILTAPADDHYTKLFLKEIRPNAKKVLAFDGTIEADDGHESLYGLSTDSVAQRLDAMIKHRTWQDRFDAYSVTMLKVGLNVPVRYHDTWIPEAHSINTARVRDETAALGFVVNYDGTDLRKPIVFPSAKGTDSISESFQWEGEHVSFHGYFYAQRTALRPEDLNGVLIRIRNAAVGEYRSDFLQYPSSKGTLFQRWVSSEIYADDRLEEALNIDRRTLRDTHPAVTELQNAYHRFLAGFLESVRTTLYEAPAKIRRTKSADDALIRMKQRIASPEINISRAAKEQIQANLDQISVSGTQSSLSKKYTAAEVYDFAIDAAQAVLRPAELLRFVEELTRRIGG